MLFAVLLLQAAPPLELTCTGGGTAIREDVATVYGAQNSGNSAWPTVHARATSGFQDGVAIRIAGDGSQIRLPAAMLPTAANGDGWFALGKLKVTDQSITGFATINPMSRPKVHIDRTTGAIRINGRSASFHGSCNAARS